MLASFFSSAMRSLAGPARLSAPTNISAAGFETRIINLNDAAAWGETCDSAISSAGTKVTHTSALTCAAVWQAVSMISSDVAGLTLNVHKRSPNGDRDIDEKHPAQPLVSVQANDEDSAHDFWGRLVLHALLWGNGYGFIRRDDEGRPIELLNLLPDRTTPVRTRDGLLFYATLVTTDAGNRKLEPLRREDVFHLKGLSIERGRGADFVAYARTAIGLSLAAEEFTCQFFDGGCQVTGVLQLPPTITNPKAISNVIEGFRKLTTKSDRFKVAILREGVTFQKVMATAREMETHEMREDQARDVARFFRMPPSKLAIAGSVSYNSQEQAQLDYLTGCLTGWLRAICAQGAMKLLTKEERLGTHYLEHNTSNFIEADTKTMADVLKTLVEAEVISSNEARKKMNLPARPGGDEYQNPNTRPAPGSQVKEEAEPVKLIDVPDVRQQYRYDCGAAAVKAVCEYFKVGPEYYAAYLVGMKTTPREGTDPSEMIDFMNEQGLIVTSGNGMTIEDLRKYFAAGIPVIVPMQLYGPDASTERTESTNGHYVVVIGAALGQVMVQDPVSGRVMLSEEDFDARWHDMEADGAVDDHFGMAVSLRPLIEEQEEEAAEPATPATPAAPAKPASSDPAPAPVAPADDTANRLARHYLTITVNRAAARLGHAARTTAKSPDKFLAWLDAGANDQKTAVDGMIRDVLEPLGGDVEAKVAALSGRFFVDLLAALKPLVEPPHESSKLIANVDAACVAFEATEGQALSQVFFK
jgi:HK97 family phage portal protein